jgi:hypothetical protein
MKRILVLVTAALVMAATMVAMAMPAFAAQPTYYCEVDINGGHFSFILSPKEAHQLLRQNDTAVCTRNR